MIPGVTIAEAKSPTSKSAAGEAQAVERPGQRRADDERQDRRKPGLDGRHPQQMPDVDGAAGRPLPAAAAAIDQNSRTTSAAIASAIAAPPRRGAAGGGMALSAGSRQGRPRSTRVLVRGDRRLVDRAAPCAGDQVAECGGQGVADVDHRIHPVGGRDHRLRLRADEVGEELPRQFLVRATTSGCPRPRSGRSGLPKSAAA